MHTKRLKQVFNTISFMTVIAILLFAALPVTANTLTVDKGFYGVNNVKVFLDGKETITDAGEFRVYYNDSSDSYMPGYCVDLTTPINYNQAYEINGTPLPENYTANGLYVEWLMDYSFTFAGNNNYKGAGLQLAIWETLYDLNPLSTENPFERTRFSYGLSLLNNSNAVAGVNGWYDHFISSLTNEINSGFNYVSSGKYVVADLKVGQDIITNPIPEPGTLILLSMGLLGLGAIGRKRT